MGRARWVDDDAGSATIVGTAVVACLIALTVALSAVGSAVTARHRATAAAELAALAAASVLLTGGAEPCAAAGRVVRAHGDSGLALAACGVDGDFVGVAVTVPVRLGRFGIRKARARARAGPVGSGGRAGEDGG